MTRLAALICLINTTYMSYNPSFFIVNSSSLKQEENVKLVVRYPNVQTI